MTSKIALTLGSKGPDFVCTFAGSEKAPERSAKRFHSVELCPSVETVMAASPLKITWTTLTPCKSTTC
eukprot:4395513-Amphidinium_carterae.1